MVIRPAESKDLDRVARVWHESAARMDGPAFEMPSLAAMRDRIDCELENGWKLYVAERDGPIAAMLAIKPSERVLDQIFVAPGEQGRGVGSTLLDFAKQTMSDGFTLRMATANSRAGRFYEQAGLTIIDEGHHPTSGVPVRYYGRRSTSADRRHRIEGAFRRCLNAPYIRSSLSTDALSHPRYRRDSARGHVLPAERNQLKQRERFLHRLVSGSILFHSLCPHPAFTRA